MDAQTLRSILKEEMGLVQASFAAELASVTDKMSQQAETLKASYREDLQGVRQEHQEMRESVHTQLQSMHRLIQKFNVDGSAPSTSTSHQTFSSVNRESPQHLPDEELPGIAVAAWNTHQAAPSWWAPGANQSAASAASAAHTIRATAAASVASNLMPDYDRKSCLLCHGKFKHKRGARQHMMKAFHDNALCKFVPGYPPHDRILAPFAQAIYPATDAEAAWKLAVRTVLANRRAA